MSIIVDSFTDVDGKTLASHVGETGASWTLPAIYNNGSLLNIYANRLTKDANGGAVLYYASGVPNADIVITTIYKILTDTGMNAGIVFRGDPNSDNFYNFRYNQGSHIWELRSTVNGVASPAFTNSTYSEILRAGDQRAIEIRAIGSSIEILIEGVSRISGSNADHSSGLVGIRMSGAAPAEPTGLIQTGELVYPIGSTANVRVSPDATASIVGTQNQTVSGTVTSTSADTGGGF